MFETTAERQSEWLTRAQKVFGSFTIRLYNVTVQMRNRRISACKTVNSLSGVVCVVCIHRPHDRIRDRSDPVLQYDANTHTTDQSRRNTSISLLPAINIVLNSRNAVTIVAEDHTEM